MSEPLHMIVPLKDCCTKEDKPVPQIRSFLITAVILQYHGRSASFDFLQAGNHTTRSYACFYYKDLLIMLPIERILPKLKLDANKATEAIIVYCGRPSMVLQMHQVLSKHARKHCQS